MGVLTGDWRFSALSIISTSRTPSPHLASAYLTCLEDRRQALFCVKQVAGRRDTCLDVDALAWACKSVKQCATFGHDTVSLSACGPKLVRIVRRHPNLLRMCARHPKLALAIHFCEHQQHVNPRSTTRASRARPPRTAAARPRDFISKSAGQSDFSMTH
eukprot:COSAG02_NODE_7239_length_3100_cov_310.313229_1_plen_159_part_00